MRGRPKRYYAQCVRLTAEERDQLDAVSEQLDLSISQILRKALREFLEELAGEKRGKRHVDVR